MWDLVVSVCSHFCFVFFCFVIYTSMASCELDSSCGYTSKIPSVLIRQLLLESPWCLTASEQCWNVKKTEKINKMAKHLKKRRGKTQVTNIRNKVLVAQLCPILCDPMVVAHQAPVSMEFSRQEYWSGLPFPSPGDLPEPGMEPEALALQADSLPFEPPWELQHGIYLM